MTSKYDFATFFGLWADVRQWEVPDVHWSAVFWLESRGPLAVLRCFRGFGKSTILDLYIAWRYYHDPTYRVLLQSESDKTAYKSSRDVQNILRRHPLTNGMLPRMPGPVEQWWVEGANDARNASMYARGILSNVTSSRADECINDDVEVQRNIQTPDAREKLRYRLGEQTHVLVPGGRKLYVGTPHTHDSLYDEQAELGADCLTIRMFAHEHRIEDAALTSYPLAFIPDVVFRGIGKGSKVLEVGKDYSIQGRHLVFDKSPGGLIDCYAGSAWPERFSLKELEKRRRETRTINEWDSQYQLHSKPAHDIRLDPARMVPYDAVPTIQYANREAMMMLGKTRIVGACARWDCSLGKITSDASAFSLVLTDAAGQLYWQLAEGLTGDLDDQCKRVKDLVIEYQIPRVVVETNGPGGFVPARLRKFLAGTGSAVVEDFSTENKIKRILDAFEPPLSMGVLWAHVSVLDGPTWDQMKDFNPLAKNQPDDYIDSGAGAIADTPVRIGQIVGKPTDNQTHPWRPSAGVHDVVFEG